MGFYLIGSLLVLMYIICLVIVQDGEVAAILFGILFFIFFAIIRIILKCLKVYHFNAGNKLLRDEQYDEAIEKFLKGNGNNQNDSKVQEAIYLKGKKLFSAGQYEEAIVVFSSLVDASESKKLICEVQEKKKRAEQESLYNEAQKLLSEGNYEEAANMLRSSSLSGYKDSERLEWAEYAENEGQYQHALQLSKSGEYEQASTIFMSISKYKDSLTWYNESQYMLAKRLFKNGQYSEAELRYNALGDYKDSKKKSEEAKAAITESQYHYAMKFFNKGQYEESMTQFHLILEYKNSLEMYNESVYLFADSLFREKKYSDAEIYFRELNNYKDSKKKIEKIKTAVANEKKEHEYENAMSLFNKGDYYNAANMFSSLGDFRNSNEMFQKSIYKYAQKRHDAGDYSAAWSYFSSIGDYRDSKEKAEKSRLEKLYNEAETMLNSQKYGEAIKQFQDLANYKDSKKKLVLAQKLQAEDLEKKKKKVISKLTQANFEKELAISICDIYFDHINDSNPRQEVYWALMRKYGQTEGRKIHNNAKDVLFPDSSGAVISSPSKARKNQAASTSAEKTIRSNQSSLIRDSYIVLDTETTGLSPTKDRVIEVSAYKYEIDRFTGQFTTLINPGRKIPWRITSLTGITDYDVENKPSFRQIARDLKKFIGDFPVVGHNAKFDYNFLVESCRRAGIKLDYEIIDTVKLAKQCYPNLPNYKLQTLIDHLNLMDHAQDHRAASDVEATAKLYKLCKERLSK